ncbi:hypothetical protein GCM10011512_02730 [Tersicoccus solisilvae]|uniref:Activator of Hsp90 ATPase homologue 1/2-like C-terminal domain-containing protein n=1 Tax=Tersicoccus solisilvae TaxID=1882339 RepID=A0ABQ1NKS6_9MICC|nr:SRPBCC domain-containing protein [Tersicoccus solisilvae]GGC79607.1 hypothetical protein GCM10011512_02730 [Tersicoccus solisilvae]
MSENHDDLTFSSLGPADSEVVIEREFAVAKEILFRAFTDPDMLAAWFGPAGWPVPRETIEIDPREGGVFRLTMVAEDETAESAVDAVIEVFEPPHRLHSSEAPQPMTGFSERTRLHLDFEDGASGGTLLKLRQGLFPAAVIAPATDGWHSSFVKLDALLAQTW